MDEKPIILSLCSGSGSWEIPYVESGEYEVIPVTFPQYDVRLFPSLPSEEARGNADWLDLEKYEGRVRGILAAPDCTYFSIAGNAWRRSDEEMYPNRLCSQAKVLCNGKSCGETEEVYW